MNQIKPGIGKKLHLLFLLCCLLAAPTVSVAQQPKKTLIDVSGVVTDEDNLFVAGVNVYARNTTIGTSTNAKGEFTLRNVPSDATIVFNYLGYKEEVVLINSRTRVDVQLTADAQSLDDVVVIGMGTLTRGDLTGSIATVDVKDMNRMASTTFEQSLMGKVAGLSVYLGDGQPGGLPKLVLRGANSVTQSNDPLYVIDGVPMESNDNSVINSLDIVSIDILKDASATAIFGARGANGVIIITTKRGQAGAPSVTFDAKLSVSKDYNRPKLMSPYEFVRYQSELSGDIGKMYLEDQDKILEDYRNVVGYDWVDQVMQTGLTQDYYVKLAGGNEGTLYSVSLSYTDQKGVLLNTGMDRYTGSFSLTQKISNAFKLDLTAGYSEKKATGTEVMDGGGNNLMWRVWAYRPVSADGIDLYKILEDPDIGSGPPRTNPIVDLKEAVNERYTRQFRTSGTLTWNILPSLKFTSLWGITQDNYETNIFNNSKTQSGRNLPGLTEGVNGTMSRPYKRRLSNDNYFTYHEVFNKDHDLKLTLAISQESFRQASFSAKGYQISNESLGIEGISQAGVQVITSSNYSRWAQLGYSFRGNYAYKGRYLATFTVRADASSRFPAENRWGYFPSGALTWRFSEENFLKNADWLDNGKLRLSYGVTGNNNVSNNASIRRLSFSGESGYYDYSFGDLYPISGGIVASVGNAQLKWETTHMINAGLDLSILKSKLNLTVDVYRKNTKDLLLNADLPGHMGFPKGYRNVGEVQNSGLEFMVNSINVSNRNFVWSTDFNISFNRNKVIALTNDQSAMSTNVNGSYLDQYIAKVGQPIGMFYGMISDDLFQYDDFYMQGDGTYRLKPEVQSQSTTANRTATLPGYEKYRDLNGDLQITLDDMTVIGNPNPDFTGGLTNNFMYKNFDFQIFFDYSYGNDILNMNKMYMEKGAQEGTNQYASYANRWTVDNPGSDIPRVRSSTNTNWISTRVIEDGSYLRLRNVNVGYTLPSKWTNRIYISTLRVYASAQNLWIWTNYSGQDPTVAVNYSALTPGYDFSAYPIPRTYVFGLTATF